jgi:UDP-N-acetylmuramate dehydrogenase
LAAPRLPRASGLGGPRGDPPQLEPALRDLLAELRAALSGEVRALEPLADHTTWGIGGPADLFAWAETEADARAIVECAARHRLPLLWIGNGSNLLVRDGGIRGIVARLGRSFENHRFEQARLVAGAAAWLPALAQRAARRGLAGLEFGIAVPATLGGAVVMNAGAYDQSVGLLVEQVRGLDPQGAPRRWGAAELEFGYRRSALRGGSAVVLEVELRLEPQPAAEVRRRTAEVARHKGSTQPLAGRSAGSVYLRPPGDFAGRIIEVLGFKGRSVGGAEVSQLHANFILNRGGARARDVLALMELIEAAAREQLGIQLEREVEIVGEPG